jgi:uncharacterized repeat protein (TIGR01451 family)
MGDISFTQYDGVIFDPPSTITVGTIITYTFSVTNLSDAILTSVSGYDNIGNLVSFGDLNISESKTQTDDYPITEDDITTGYVISSAAVEGTYSGNPIYDTRWTQVDLNTPPTVVLEQYSGSISIVGTLYAGTPITYTYQVHNTGGYPLTDVTVVDDLGHSIVIGNLAVDETQIVTHIYYLQQSDISNGTVDSQAVVNATFATINISSTAVDSSIPIPQVAEINIISYIGTIADPSIVIGSLVTYTTIVQNIGNWPLTDVTIFDTLGSTVVLGNMAPEQTKTGISNYPITEDDIKLGYIDSFITVTGLSTIGSVIQQKALKVTLGTPPAILLYDYYGTISDPLPLIGTPITYTYVVQNMGNYPLSAVTITDDIGSVVNVGTLAISQTKTVTHQYYLVQSDINQGQVNSNAVVTGSFETIDVTSSKSTIVTITQLSDLSLSKKTTSVEDYVGGTINYTLTITNTGNLSIHQIRLYDQLLEIEEIITLLIPSVYIYITGSYILTKDDIARGFVSNTALVIGLDPNEKNVSTYYHLMTPIPVNRPSIQLFKTVNSVGTAVGDTVNYTLKVTNNGNVSLSQVNLKDYLLGIDLTTSLNSHQVYTKTGSYTLLQSDFDRHYVTNTAYVTGLTPKSQEIADEMTIVTPLMLDQPSIFLSKEAVSTDNRIGGTIRYQLGITNNGNETLHHVTLQDTKLGINETLNDPLEPRMSYMELADYTITAKDFEAYLVTNTAIVTALDTADQEVSMSVKLNTVPCVVRDTMILMMDDTLKPIQDIQRGDWVAPNHQVARLCETVVPTATVNDLMILKAHCLADGLPNRDLLITSNHPIFYEGARRPAWCFKDLVGVSQVKRNDIPMLYDLQFEHDGSYIASGIEIQSCSPYSFINPLPKELYFDQSLYSNEFVWDAYDQTMRLTTELLKPIRGRHLYNKRTSHLHRREKYHTVSDMDRQDHPDRQGSQTEVIDNASQMIPYKSNEHTWMNVIQPTLRRRKLLTH